VAEPAALARVPGAPTEDGRVGEALWDFIASFVAARWTFLSIYDRYERRVLRAAKTLGVKRESLVLPPLGLFKLFHLRRMDLLRDYRLKPLRNLAQRVFEDAENEELLDVYCSHIYHEFTILSEEHRSVGRFLRIHDNRRYRQPFEEVSGYYPMRLRRIRRLFTGGLRRIEILLPEWSRYRVVVRSMHLFGDRLARKTYGEGIDVFYRRMYPLGGPIQGHLEAARSFLDSGFLIQARGAVEESLGSAAALTRRRALERPEREALQQAEDLAGEIERRVGAESLAG
jgi:hypothetical protein